MCDGDIFTVGAVTVRASICNRGKQIFKEN